MSDEPKKGTIAQIATIVVACYVALAALIGLIGRNSFTPIIIDEMFGISEHVKKEIMLRVDSGYSRTFVFSPGVADDRNQLIFYAEDGQPVKVSINGYSRGDSDTGFRILVDNSPWEGVRELPFNSFHMANINITNKLKFDQPPQGNLHALKFVPERLEEDSLIVLECLVLVYVQ
jgi:hypothetical protein